MDPESDKNTMMKFAWGFLFVSLALLAGALTWRYYSVSEIESSRAAATQNADSIASSPVVPAPAAQAENQTLQPKPTAYQADPTVESGAAIVDTQVEWLQRQADAATNDPEFPPRSIAPSAESIKETKEKGLMLE